MTHMRHDIANFGSSMNKNGRLKCISPAPKHFRLAGHFFLSGPESSSTVYLVQHREHGCHVAGIALVDGW